MPKCNRKVRKHFRGNQKRTSSERRDRGTHKVTNFRALLGFYHERPGVTNFRHREKGHAKIF
jgi:hypothetical protein